MKNGFKKWWPYVLGLLILAAIAIFSGDYLPFEWWGNKHEVMVEDSMQVEADTLTIDESGVKDTVQVDTTQTLKPVYEEQPDESVKMWRLVIASVPSQEHAYRIQEQLNVAGSEVKYVDRLSTYRVVYGSYAELSQAQEAYDAVSSKYPKAWLVLF